MEKETASFWAGIKKFEDILERDPNAYSFAPLAEIYRKLSLPDEALRIARKGVSLHPEFVAGQMALASSCLDKALVDEARQALEVVVRITPENLDAQRALADIYLSAGNVASADACLRIVASLDPFVFEEAAVTTPAPSAVELARPSQEPMSMAAAASDEDEILDLTDDLIEMEVFEEEPYTPFAAAPERPSLLAAREKSESMAVPQTKEPFGEEKAIIAPVITAAEEDVQSPSVLTATIAELYVSQGLIGKGLEVYRELLRENPDNVTYKERYLELTGSTSEVTMTAADAVVPAVGQGAVVNVSPPEQGAQDPVVTLEGWLGNIRRIRECRTEIR